MSEELDLWKALILGVVQGLTEFLPVSSTGHLTFGEALFGYEVDAPDVTAFTAIVQLGAVIAVLIYFRADIARILRALWAGAVDPVRRSGEDWTFGIAVLIGSLPIGFVGLAFQDQIETTLRSLWLTGVALILWSGVMWFADRRGTQERGEDSVSNRDTLIIGLVQCVALIPGVSRSGATMSAGLLRGIDRVSVTRLSFFLAIPALGAATVLQTVTHYDKISGGIGWPAMILATVISFFVAYAAVAWLLRYIARHTYAIFIGYRILIGAVILALLATGVVD